MTKPIDLPVAEMVNLYSAGHTTPQLAVRFRVSPTSIFRRLRAAGVVKRKGGSRPLRELRDLVGQRFGRLVVESRDTTRGDQWFTVCDCGQRTSVYSGNLQQGRTRSCGCLRVDFPNRLKHAAAVHGAVSKEYWIWQAAKQRCANPRNKSYADYGGRGIRMCDEWARSFEAFMRDMGPRPSPDHSIDRIDNDRGYEKENVRWSMTVVQQNNTSRNRHVVVNGERLTVAQASRQAGVPMKLVYERLYAGWPIERALGLSI